MPHDVIISYATVDKPTADAVCAKLEERGIRCWIAPRDILPGADYAASIVSAIDSAKIMVLIFSSHANASKHVMREAERAVHDGYPIIPFRIEDVQPTLSLQYYISAQHWLDALTPPLEQHILKLADTVSILLGKQAPPARETPPQHPEPLLYEPVAGPYESPPPARVPPPSRPKRRTDKRFLLSVVGTAVAVILLFATVIEPGLSSITGPHVATDNSLSGSPSVTPVTSSPSPTPTPTPVPTPTPTFFPTPTPTPVPTPTPTPVPSRTPTFFPTPTPTPVPSRTPTFFPTPTPTFLPGVLGGA